MKNGIFISIKPQYLRLIESGEKNYEFRSYCPKEKINVLYVYESSPTCKLKYIMYIGDIIEFPNQIDELGIGNKEFNQGNKYKYAYQIKGLKVLDKPVDLKTLKERYQFFPPQAYTYESKYPDLVKYLEESNYIKIK